jgi:predicted alpha/beta hydrolase family esterase
MKKQVLIIHGGEVFASYEDFLNHLKNRKVNPDYLKTRKWKDSLQQDLGDEWDVIYPQMPNKQNAKYLEWKIWFEKYIPFLRDGAILIGNSLGGIFLAKYLSENDFPVKIKYVFLIAAPFDRSVAGFNLSDSLEKFSNQVENIALYYSKDDPEVPFEDLEKYAKALPEATKVTFENKGHFMLEEFPEFIEKIKNI